MEDVKAERAALKAGRPEDEAAGWFAGAEGMLKGRGIAAGLANALPAFGKEVIKMKQENRKADQLLRASEIQLATADQARADGMVGKAADLEKDAQAKAQKAAELQVSVAEKEATIASSIRNADVQASASMASSMKPTDLDKQTKIRYAAALEAGEPANAATMSKAAQQAASDLGRYPGEQRAAAAEDKSRVAANVKATDIIDDKLAFDSKYRELLKKDRPAALAQRDEMIAREAARLSSAPAAASVPPVRGGAPTAAVGLQAKVEQSGQKYEPAKYDYRIAPDGSIQRKAK